MAWASMGEQLLNPQAQPRQLGQSGKGAGGWGAELRPSPHQLLSLLAQECHVDVAQNQAQVQPAGGENG